MQTSHVTLQNLSPLSKLPELDEFHYHEMMDRLHVAMDTINTHIQQHPVSKMDTEIKDHICKAVDHLWLAYQLTGQKQEQ